MTCSSPPPSRSARPPATTAPCAAAPSPSWSTRTAGTRRPPGRRIPTAPATPAPAHPGDDVCAGKRSPCGRNPAQTSEVLDGGADLGLADAALGPHGLGERADAKLLEQLAHAT